MSNSNNSVYIFVPFIYPLPFATYTSILTRFARQSYYILNATKNPRNIL